MPWFDIEEDYYAGRLDDEIAETWSALKAANQDFTGFEVCRDLSTAMQLLAYSNRKAGRNELIVVRSHTMATVKGGVAPADVGAVRWAGFDVVALGHWSLLEGGLFVAPNYFKNCAARLTNEGLLDGPISSEEYLRDYVIAARDNAVEELPPLVYEVDLVEIGRRVEQR